MSKASPAMDKISVSLHRDLIDHIDMMCATSYASRSAFIASLVRANKQKHVAKALKAIKEANAKS